MPDDEEYIEFDTGPFCMHWSDPCDCEEVCPICGVLCKGHADADHDFPKKEDL